MDTGAEPSRLEQVLQDSWETILQLPDDDAAFDRLSPSQRRQAHDLGVRCQDRLTRALARLVGGMAADGVELVDEKGLAAAMKPLESGPSNGD